MPSLAIQVAISKPLWGEYYHWGLDVYDEEEDTHYVFEALGEPHKFLANSDEYDPKSLPRFWKKIHVARLHDVEIDDIREVVDCVPVRNDLAHWSCQDYVIEILDGLEDESLLKRNPEYDRAKEVLLMMVGPVEDTRHHILAYRAPGERDSSKDDDLDDDHDEDEGDSCDDEKVQRILSEEIVVDSDSEGEVTMSR